MALIVFAYQTHRFSCDDRFRIAFRWVHMQVQLEGVFYLSIQFVAALSVQLNGGVKLKEGFVDVG